MPTRSFGSDTIAPHANGTMINMAKCQSLQHKVTNDIGTKSLHHAAHPAQIAKPFLAKGPSGLPVRTLIGLAMGMDGKELGLGAHFVPLGDLLEKKAMTSA